MINLKSPQSILDFLKKETEHQLSLNQKPFGSELRLEKSHDNNKWTNGYNRVKIYTANSKKPIFYIYSNKNDTNQVFFYYFPKFVFNSQARYIQSLLKTIMNEAQYDNLECNIIGITKPIKNLFGLERKNYSPWDLYYFFVPSTIIVFGGIVLIQPVFVIYILLVLMSSLACCGFIYTFIKDN
jgi:hypothetical protein